MKRNRVPGAAILVVSTSPVSILCFSVIAHLLLGVWAEGKFLTHGTNGLALCTRNEVLSWVS